MNLPVTAWRIASDGRDHEAHELDGKGAALAGGRWNRPGMPVVYLSTSAALACLETVVHLGANALPLNRFLVEVTIPRAVWARRLTWTCDTLPVGWSATPEGKVSLDRGDAWLRSGKSALLQVPSVIVPEESNLLLNPAHPHARQVTACKRRPWFYDGRMGIGERTGRAQRPSAQRVA